ncbi:MAG: hypothetical protein LUC85_06710 [Bacteroidales bacterium]|nr:hypothetical protein [Bacteroidales bacterium]
MIKANNILRLQQEIDFLRSKQAAYLSKGCYHRAAETMRRITEKQAKLNAAIEQAEIDLAMPMVERPLAEVVDRATLDKHKIPDMIIETILAADFLNDCFFNLKSSLKKLGIVRSDCDKYAEDMEKITRQYTNHFLQSNCIGLTRLVSENEQLIDELHMCVYSYMNKKLNVLKTQ